MERVKKFRIEKIQLSPDREKISISTDAPGNFMLMFMLKDIKDKKDFQKQLKQRVKETLDINKDKAEAEAKYKLLKTLEGSELDLD